MAPSSSEGRSEGRDDSPDRASHARIIYDAAGNENQWQIHDDSEDAEFFDPTEDVEADFHGMGSKIEKRLPFGSPMYEN